MTVHELITALQDCDKPDAVITIRFETDSEPLLERGVSDVYYRSSVDNQVFIEAEK